MMRKVNQAVAARLGPRLTLESLRRFTGTTNPEASKEKWDLYAGVLVERLPIVSKSFAPLEQQFQELLWRMEFERSYKSNHELRHEQDLVQAELIKTGKIAIDLDESSSKQTAQDLKDAYIEEYKKFVPESRLTADDKTNNVASTNRCLEDNLYLLIEQNLGKESHLLLPQGIRLDGETMRQTAERILIEKCGNQLEVRFYGNAPCGFYKYKYPVSVRKENSTGAKIFFYRAALLNGNVDKSKAKNFEWLAKTALGGKLKNAAYYDSVQRFVL